MVVTSEIALNNYGQTYPVLMDSALNVDGDATTIIVLFSERRVGMVVYSGKEEKYPIGYYCADWDMSCFRVCERSVTLRNE